MYTDQDIINNVPRVSTMAGLLRELKLKPAGGNYASIKKKLHRLSVDTSHWKGQAWSKDEQLKDWSKYVRPSSLRKLLIKERGNVCENCGLSQWMNEVIAVEVHHEDGDRTNNTLTNLSLLCPNCHSLTDTWRGRNNK